METRRLMSHREQEWDWQGLANLLMMMMMMCWWHDDKTTKPLPTSASIACHTVVGFALHCRRVASNARYCAPARENPKQIRFRRARASSFCLLGCRNMFGAFGWRDGTTRRMRSLIIYCLAKGSSVDGWMRHGSPKVSSPIIHILH